MIQVGVKLRINYVFQDFGKIIIRSNIGRGIFFRMGVIMACLKKAGSTPSDRMGYWCEITEYTLNCARIYDRLIR